MTLTPGENLDNLLKSLLYLKTENESEVSQAVAESKQALADFIEGEVKRIIGDEWHKGSESYNEGHNTLHRMQRQRLQELVKELRA